MSLRGPGPRTIVRARPRCVESCALRAVVPGARGLFDNLARNSGVRPSWLSLESLLLCDFCVLSSEGCV